MNENISNSFSILKEFIEKISQKSNTCDNILMALDEHINNNIDPNIDELNTYIGELNTKYDNLKNNISNNKIELTEYDVDESSDIHYYSLNL